MAVVVVWFGIIEVGAMLLSLGANEVVRRRINADKPGPVAQALLGLNAILGVSVAAFGLAGSFGLALAAYWMAAVARAVADHLCTTWLNQQVSSGVRATVLSIGGQANALGQIALGPAVGAIGALVSLRAALVVAGALLSPALLLYSRALRRSEPVPVGADE